jgi:hypothetical protein
MLSTTLDALDKRALNLRRKIQETDALLERKRAGEELEPNQVAKLRIRREREEELDSLSRQRRELLVAGGCVVGQRAMMETADSQSCRTSTCFAGHESLSVWADLCTAHGVCSN